MLGFGYRSVVLGAWMIGRNSLVGHVGHAGGAEFLSLL